MRQLQCYLIIAITFLFFLFLPYSSLARHIVGGEMSYTCLGNGDYEIQLLIYRDCLSGGGNFDREASISIYQCGNTIDCNVLQQGSQSLNFTVPLGAVTLENQPDATCLLPQVCIEQGVYKFRLSDFQFFLPQVNNSYHIVYQRCCRNEAITNIISPNETGSSYTVEITPEAQLSCNTSPQFTTFPPAVICTNEPFQFEHNAIDAEGDSLVYAFTAPLLGGGLDLTSEGRNACSGIVPNPSCPPPYNKVAFIGGDFDSTHPFGNNLQIAPSTGIISGTPTIQGHYVASIAVSEYRNGQFLSTTQREFQITIANCDQLNERTGSICDDGNPNTENDLIQSDCLCKGTVKESVLNTPDLLFSEYIEGDDGNKCLEIYNPLNIAVDLSEYVVKVFTDGSQNGTILKSLTGILAPNNTYIICKSSADLFLLNAADATFEGDFDGNDALSLEKNNILVDLFGNIGCDPGTAWNGTGARTQNQTLLRCPCVENGVKADPDNCDFPTLDTEWISLPNGNYVNLGQSTSEQQGDPTIQFLTNLLCNCQPICKARDSLALIDLYNATNGPQWTTTWDLRQPMSQWFGVEVNEEGCVTCLDLDGIADCNNNSNNTNSGNNLQGTLPLSIGDLKDLTALYLSNNSLINKFPSTIGYLLNLTALDISHNQLSGSIPPAIGNLNQLEFLWLNSNSLSDSIPLDMGLLQNIKILNAENNALINSIPEGIGNFQNLEFLNFSNNQLTGCYPTSLLNHCDINPDFSNNPQLAWEGDFNTFCLSENQESAPCDDDNPDTMEDRIQDNCICSGTLPQLEEECATITNLEALTTDTTIIVCDDSEILEASQPMGFSGIWSTNSEDVMILKRDTAITEIDNLPIGTTLFTWTLDTLNCETYEPNVFQLQRLASPLVQPDTFFIDNQSPPFSFEVTTNDQLASTDFTIDLLNSNTLETITNMGNGIFQYQSNSNSIESINFNYELCYTVCPDYCDRTNVELTAATISTDNPIIPNAITPNGDQLNEFLFFWHLETPEEFPNNELIIFNRWGDIVYQAIPYNNDWNGINRSGDKLPEGTYYYILRLDLSEGEILRGAVTILR